MVSSICSSLVTSGVGCRHSLECHGNDVRERILHAGGHYLGDAFRYVAASSASAAANHCVCRPGEHLWTLPKHHCERRVGSKDDD